MGSQVNYQRILDMLKSLHSLDGILAFYFQRLTPGFSPARGVNG